MLPFGVFIVHLLVDDAQVFDELAERAKVVVAALDLFVENDAVEPFLGRFGNEFFGQCDVLLAGETEAVDDFFDLVFRVFNALGNLHFLLAREQRHLAHLLEVHPNRVVQNVQPALVLFLFRLRLLDAVNFRLVHNFHFEVAELGVDLIQFLGRDHRVRQRIVDVVVSEVTLFLGQPNQFLDLLGQIETRVALNGANRLLIESRMLGRVDRANVAVRTGGRGGSARSATCGRRHGQRLVFEAGFFFRLLRVREGCLGAFFRAGFWNSLPRFRFDHSLRAHDESG